MLDITLKTVSEMDVLYGLYQLAIDFTRKIRADDQDEIEKWLDVRQRLLSQTAAAAASAKILLTQFEQTRYVPANEAALILEKKYLLSDTMRRMKSAEHEVIRKMREKMKSIRGDLAHISCKRKAAQAYISAPRAALASA